MCACAYEVLTSESSVPFCDMTLPAKSAYRLLHRHNNQLAVDTDFDSSCLELFH